MKSRIAIPMGQEFDLLVALDDAENGGSRQNARGKEHDEKRLPQFLADEPQYGRDSQDGGDFDEGVSMHDPCGSRSLSFEKRFYNAPALAAFIFSISSIFPRMSRMSGDSGWCRRETGG